RRALRKLVESGTTPGLIAYAGDNGRSPVGWISLRPREEYARLERSSVMKPVDDRPVWSIVCFFLQPPHRWQGLAQSPMVAGMRYARARGARLLEAYQIDKPQRGDANAMWFGAKRMYDRAGFREVARRRPARPIVRRALRQVAR